MFQRADNGLGVEYCCTQCTMVADCEGTRLLNDECELLRRVGIIRKYVHN